LVAGLGTFKKIMTGRKLGERRIKKNIALTHGFSSVSPTESAEGK